MLIMFVKHLFCCWSHIDDAQDGFTVKTTSGQVHENVDLSDGEWVEYDEKLGESVGVMELEHKLIVHK